MTTEPPVYNGPPPASTRYARALRARLDRLDATVVAALARVAPLAARISLGVVFLWFGALKFVPGASPAEDLALGTIAVMTGAVLPDAVARIALAALETGIGLGFLTGRYLRATIVLLLAQMVGALAPLVYFPQLMFDGWPWKPTIEGQYVVKNLVLIGAALTVGGSLRARHA